MQITITTLFGFAKVFGNLKSKILGDTLAMMLKENIDIHLKEPKKLYEED